jgi:hypothetical protein
MISLRERIYSRLRSTPRLSGVMEMASDIGQTCELFASELFERQQTCMEIDGWATQGYVQVEGSTCMVSLNVSFTSRCGEYLIMFRQRIKERVSPVPEISANGFHYRCYIQVATPCEENECFAASFRLDGEKESGHPQWVWEEGTHSHTVSDLSTIRRAFMRR